MVTHTAHRNFYYRYLSHSSRYFSTNSHYLFSNSHSLTLTLTFSPQLSLSHLNSCYLFPNSHSLTSTLTFLPQLSLYHTNSCYLFPNSHSLISTLTISPQLLLFLPQLSLSHTNSHYHAFLLSNHLIFSHSWYIDINSPYRIPNSNYEEQQNWITSLMLNNILIKVYTNHLLVQTVPHDSMATGSCLFTSRSEDFLHRRQSMKEDIYKRWNCTI